MTPRWHLDTASSDFADCFARMTAARRASGSGVRAQTLATLDAVRSGGWEALCAASERFDGFMPSRVGEAELDAALASLDSSLREALEIARDRLAAWCRAQAPQPARWEDAGVALSMDWVPLDRVGVYAPGGQASYPSSVVMNIVPARVAGVEAVVLATPARDSATLAAARLAGASEVWRMGGAQAIAALAYGAGAIAPVAMIAGPGSAWVAEAKRQVYGQVGIDMLAGPSEILVIADGSANPDWVALDLLAQAEHDPLAQAVAIADDAALLAKIAERVSAHLATMPRAETARASWQNHGALILVRDLAEAPALADAMAPEHVQVMTRDAEAMAARVRRAGAVFVGAYASEALADYTAGSCHVLPTMGSARFASGLGPHDFMRRRVVMRANRDAACALGAPAAVLARAEGLYGHEAALQARRAKP